MKILRRSFFTVCMFSLVAFSGSFVSKAFAVYPVIDWTAIGYLVQQLTQMAAQLEEMKLMVNEMQGHYGSGSFMNGEGELKVRQWSPGSWDDALQGLSGGNPGRYQQLWEAYHAEHPSLSKEDYAKGASEDLTRQYDQKVKVNQAVMVNATYAFNDINQHIRNVYDISQKIDQAQNTKSAMDLNSRLLTEIAYIQAQELKMQILLNQQLSQNSSDQISEETELAKFNQLPGG